MNLQALTPGQLTAFYRHLLTGGRRDGKGGLAPKTVKNIHATLHPALGVAMRWGYVVRNVADAVDLPKVSPRRCKSGARAAPRVSCPRARRPAVRRVDAVRNDRDAPR